MTKRIERNRGFLQLLQKVKAVGRKKLIRKATRDNIDALSEVALNTLLGNVPLTSHHKQKLKRHRIGIRCLAKKGTSLKQRKEFLVQKEGFLPLLIPPVLSIAGGLAANALSHLIGL